VTRILIVDDDRTMVLALSVRLRKTGLEVLTCHNAYEAPQIVLRERPDAILLDIDMPHFTGLEVHECLRLAERSRRIPVIYVSGSISPIDRQVALRQGAKAFLVKPFETQALLDTIHTVLNEHGDEQPS
jgi:twitching motility two-component system response regulator PilH